MGIELPAKNLKGEPVGSTDFSPAMEEIKKLLSPMADSLGQLQDSGKLETQLKDSEAELAKLKEESTRLNSPEYKRGVLDEKAGNLNYENWLELGRRLSDAAVNRGEAVWKLPEPEPPAAELKEDKTTAGKDGEQAEVATTTAPAKPLFVVKVGNKLYPVREE